MLLGKKQKKSKDKKKNKAARKKIVSKYPKKNNDKLKSKLNILLYSLAIVPICIYLLSRYTYTTKVQMEITNKEIEINTLKEKRNALRLELEEIKNSGYIEKQAKIRMNMRKADENQLIYIDVK